jgi:hypothetical protein
VMTRPSLLHVVALLALALLLGGCPKDALIPNTKVKDTPENRALLKVVETYRQAVESRDAGGVLALVHPTYLDNAGTPEGFDDVDFEGLKKLLNSRFKRAQKIRYHIEPQAVRVLGRDAEVDAYVDATFVYEPEAGPSRWRRLTDYDRFKLIKDGGEWRFISGL